MTTTIAETEGRRPVTTLPAAELEDIVLAASRRPCAAPDAKADDWFPAEPKRGKGPKARARHEARVRRYEARAMALCRFCPVAIECLELAIHGEGRARGYGIAGGTAPWQRQAIKASRGLAVRRG
jgi:hypothetical protein